MRNTYVANYRKARADLLLMAVLTTINMVLLMVDAKYAFAFSATFPQLSVALGLELAEEFGSAALVIGAVMGFASIGPVLSLLGAVQAPSRCHYRSARAVFAGYGAHVLVL